MKKFFFTALLSCMFVVHAFAQNEVEHPNYWRSSFGLMTTIPNPDNSDQILTIDDLSFTRSIFDAEWSRRCNNYLEIGIYTGFKDGSKFQQHSEQVFNYETGLYDDVVTNDYIFTQAIMIGATCRFHLLPFIHLNNDNWDLYLSSRWGGWFADKLRTDFGFGAGVNFFPTKHVGLYAENNWGRFAISTQGCFQHSIYQFNIGLIIR